LSRSRHPRTLPAVACLVAVIGLGLAVLPAAAADKVIVVQAGDTLSEIAVEQGVTVAQLVALNGIRNPGLIYVGQRLRVQASAPAAPAAPVSLIHVVASGENLTVIAHRYGTSIAAIVTANAISNPSFLRVGQRLTIPGVAGAAAASVRGAGLPTAIAAAVASRASIGSLIAAEASAAGIDPAFAMAVAWHESGWRQEVVSSAGAIGVMQLMPATGDWVASLLGEAPNVHDLRWNVHAGVQLLDHYLDRYHGDRSLALAAYYQGERATDIHGIYAISRPYIASILALQAIFSR
jgi:N-acetylmuramoyl-L-alanine amidase